VTHSAARFKFIWLEFSSQQQQQQQQHLDTTMQSKPVQTKQAADAIVMLN